MLTIITLSTLHKAKRTRGYGNYLEYTDSCRQLFTSSNNRGAKVLLSVFKFSDKISGTLPSSELTL